MAFSYTQKTIKGVSSYQSGPFKMEIGTYSAVSGDTSGTITAGSLHRIDFVHVVGSLALTADTTYSGATATLAFTDPVATVKGTVILYGA